MRPVARPYWIKTGICTAVAFVIGIAAYVCLGIMMTQKAANADAATHTITVTVETCDCIVKFAPNPTLEGDGTLNNPYISYNSSVPVMVGVSGLGHVEIKDGTGRVVYAYDQTVDDYVETPAQLSIQGGPGVYAFSVWFNGVEVISETEMLESPMYIEYRGLPVGPPNTGAGSYMYVAGYAVQTGGAMSAGVVVAALVFGIFVLVAMKRQNQKETSARGRKADGKKIKREVSAKTIDRSGVAGKKKPKKR